MRTERTKRSPEVHLQIGALRIRLQETLSVAVGLIGLIAGIATFAVGLREKRNPDPFPKGYVETLVARYSELTNEIAALNSRVLVLASQSIALTNISPEGLLSAQVHDLSDNSTRLSNRLVKLETAILQDPAKALEMPLLRKDFDHLKGSYEADSVSIKNEVARIYDLNKWFIGLMFSMALGIIGLAITNFLKVKKAED